MKIEEITVHAGRTFNHPYEDYSNLKPGISLKAILSNGDDPEEAVKALQAKAEKLVEDHKTHILRSLSNLYELRRAQQEISSLEQQIKRSQENLDAQRKVVDEIAEQRNLIDQ